MTTLSVVVRFHSLERLFELRRCIFSLVGQSYRPLEICLVTQRFTESETETVAEALRPILALCDADFSLYDYSESQPLDARSALINLGIEKARGKYLAFLDHDDTILPLGYATLIAELEKTEAAIAFASVAYKVIDVFQDALLVDKRLEAFVGKSLDDLFDHNFCPIHSFVINRSRVDSGDLWFDTNLSKHEDYEFLLRICAKYRSSFQLIGTFVGDYYLKNDGSNTNTWLSAATTAVTDDWQDSSKFLDSRKKEILLSPDVRRDLKLDHGRLTIWHVIMGSDDHP